MGVEMGTVSRLPGGQHEMTVTAAVDKYLNHVHATKSTRTWRAHGLTFQKFCDEFGSRDVGALDPDAVAGWFTGRWGQGSAQGWNANRAALTSAGAWWRDQPDIPVTSDPFSRIGRRAVPPDRSRALDRATIERLLTDQRTPLRERCFWSLLYDSAARSAEVLRLDVEDLDLANHRSRVVRKGGGHDMIVWKGRTARLLSNYLDGRTSGPVFVTSAVLSPTASSARATWTGGAGPGCPTSGPSSCSSRPPAARPCTCCGIRPSPTTRRTGRPRRC
jgi:integrase